MERYQFLHKHTYDAGLAADNEKEAAYIRSIQKTRMAIDGHTGRHGLNLVALAHSFLSQNSGVLISAEARDAMLDDLNSLEFPPNVTAAQLRAAGIQLADPDTTRFPSVGEMVAMQDRGVDPIGIQRARPPISERPVGTIDREGSLRRPPPRRDAMVPEGWERRSDGIIAPQRPVRREPPAGPPPRIDYEGMNPEQWQRFKKIMKVGSYFISGIGIVYLLDYLFG